MQRFNAPGLVRLQRRRYRWGVGVLALLLLLFGGLYLNRNSLARWAFTRVQASYYQQYHLQLTAATLRVKGISTLQLDSLMVRVPGKQVLFSCTKLIAELRLSRLLVGKLALKALTLEKAIVTVDACKESYNLPKVNKVATATLEANPDFSGQLEQLTTRFFARLPKYATLQQLRISLRQEDGYYNYQVPFLQWDEDTLVGKLLAGRQSWQLRGSFPQGKPHLSFTTHDSGFAELPLLAQRFNLKLGTHALHLKIHELEVHQDEVTLTAELGTRNFLLAQPRLSRMPIRLDTLQANLKMRILPNVVRLDSASTLVLNRVVVKPYLSLSLGRDTAIALHLLAPPLPAQQLLDALPPALFSSTVGMQAQGKLGYELRFAYDSRQRDTVQFSSKLAAENFKVTRYGNAFLPKLNGEFTHYTYREGRAIVVGPSNPRYTPLAEVSEYLKHALLVSEDGDFYAHQGFNEKAIRKALLLNIQRRGFVRGGSTLTQQLVKNVFLRPDRTLGRKLEEAFLVWLLEHQQLVSKSRMLEVYLNVVEWGPNVYGVAEASDFYFGRHPLQLYIPQSIFLAFILPRPRAYMYNFEPDGQLKEFTKSYFKLIGSIMKARNYITEEEYDLMLEENLRLTGRSLELLQKTLKQQPADSLPATLLPFQQAELEEDLAPEEIE